ncbi:MAG: 5-formyltetrahydrofolate cyclo-ligase, partial [Mobilitalea sp.]
MTKNQIRIRNKQQRNSLSIEEQTAFSRAIQERLFALDSYLNCKSLFSYVSFQSEVDTTHLIHQALSDYKKVYIPRVEKKHMNFYRINNLEDLIRSEYGILEPSIKEETRYSNVILRKDQLISNVKLEENDIIYHDAGFSENNRVEKRTNNLMILPGLAFDIHGNRVGYGAGYYDSYLAKLDENHFIKIALAYDFQVENEIPSDLSDSR